MNYAQTTHHKFHSNGVCDNANKYVIMEVANGNTKGRAFIDSGCTFNAVSSSFAIACGLKVEELPNDVVCEVGGGKEIRMKRRVAHIEFDLGRLGTYATYVFVIDPIPIGVDVLFGMDFLINVNPDIDWIKKTTSLRSLQSEKIITEERDRLETLFHFSTTPHLSESGETLIIDTDEYLKEIEKNEPNDYFFVIQLQQGEKINRFKRQGWEALKHNPAYETLLKYKATVFQDTLDMNNAVQSDIQHSIELQDRTPFHVKQFRISPDQQAAVSKWVEEMETAGIIRKSNSPFNSPIFCVKKPIGWRIVNDFRLLNSRTRIPRGPIPRKDEIQEAMQGSWWFSAMDLLSGYYQLLLREEDRELTAFSTPKGQYEYVATAQGLAGAPSTFNRFVKAAFDGLQDICRSFFDDLFVFTRSKDPAVHIAALDRVLRRCEEKGLRIKIEKCVFLAAEIPVLGDFVGREGVRVDPDKVAVLKDWPTPTTKKELKSFLGTIVYCSRFLKNYGKLVAPLQELLAGKHKNAPITFTAAQASAFAQLKQAMCETPVLALADFSKTFGIRMDASDYAIGGVLFQLDENGEEHPVAYTGRRMGRAELNYPVREKELLAIMHALRVWRHYLIDQPFTVETDHQSLESIFTQRTCSQRLARWLNELSEYRPNFHWIAGDTNCTADGISRRSDFMPVNAPSGVDLRSLLRSMLNNIDTNDELQQLLHFQNYDVALFVMYALSSSDLMTECRTYYAQDRYLSKIWKFFKEGGQKDSRYKNFHFADDLLWKKHNNTFVLCIPHRSEIINKVIFSEHDDPAKGHPGIFKTLHNLRRKYWWTSLTQTVSRYIKTCEKCMRNKYRQTKPPGLLQPLPIPEARWTDIAMDFILDLPLSNGNNAIWVIVCRLTKRAHFIPIFMGDNESSARNCALIFCKEFQRLHGIPESIISDRDSRFTSVFWQTLMERQGTNIMLSSAFRPNTDGQSERTHRFIQDYLRNYVYPCQSNWSELLFAAEYAYNARRHDSIRMSPFEADLGYIPKAIPDHMFEKIVGNKNKKEAYEFGQKQQEILVQLKINLDSAQERMKHYYDLNRPIQNFEIGDQVLLSSENLDIEHLGVIAEGSKKFAPLWIGPYPILKKTSIDTYKLQLTSGLRLHPEFHTSLLKPYYKDDDNSRANKPNEGMIVAGSTDHGFLVENIVGHKKVRGKIYYRVQWLGYSDDHNTWEPIANLIKPASNLIKNYLVVNKLDEKKWFPNSRRKRVSSKK